MYFTQYHTNYTKLINLSKLNYNTIHESLQQLVFFVTIGSIKNVFIPIFQETAKIA